MHIPGFSQGGPLPPGPRHVYGSDETIHHTGTIDIQVTPGGEVVAVWFRCLNLPFTVSVVPDGHSVINPPISIDMIAYADREAE